MPSTAATFSATSAAKGALPPPATGRGARRARPPRGSGRARLPNRTPSTSSCSHVSTSSNPAASRRLASSRDRRSSCRPASPRSSAGIALPASSRCAALVAREMLPSPPHWATRRPCGFRGPRQALEEPVVVLYPVKRRGREDEIHRLLDLELREILALHPHPRLPGEPPPRRLDHRPRTCPRQARTPRAASRARAPSPDLSRTRRRWRPRPPYVQTAREPQPPTGSAAQRASRTRHASHSRARITPLLCYLKI